MFDYYISVKWSSTVSYYLRIYGGKVKPMKPNQTQGSWGGYQREEEEAKADGGLGLSECVGTTNGQEC